MRRVLIAFLSFLLLPASKALAGLIEYALILVLLASVEVVFGTAPLPIGSNEVLHHLDEAVHAAQQANANGSRQQELSHLSKALGSAEALLGITASCDTCGDARNDLQQIVGLATQLRARVLHPSRGCNPDGVIGANEQCDPLADPTGCPTDLTFPTFCDDGCHCETTVIP